MDEAGDDDSILALVDELLRELHLADQSLHSADQDVSIERAAIHYALIQCGRFVDRVWKHYPSVPATPTNALKRLANALGGLADGATNDPVLQPEERAVPRVRLCMFSTVAWSLRR